MKPPTAIIFEPTPNANEMLRGSLGLADFEIIHVGDPIRLLSLIKDGWPNLVIISVASKGTGFLSEMAARIRSVQEEIPIVVIALEPSEDLAIAALRAGVDDYLRCPFTPEDLLLCLNRSVAKRPQTRNQRDENQLARATDPFVGDSAPMRRVRERLAKVAATESNILITGETGTGKELAAVSLHRQSPRFGKPFFTINCAAIPDSIFESELFGHERGAFTGADQCREGRLKAADGGTVFLDEIGDMSMYGQAKILRMIENHEIQRLGRSSGISVDVRVVAATNQDLEQLSEKGNFRRDLFFRLAVSALRLPALRERSEDVPQLVAHYIRYFNARFGRSVRALSDESMDILQTYDWPGNVRELKNLVEAIFMDLPALQEVDIVDLPLQFRERCARRNTVSVDERTQLMSALSAANWNKSKAASTLHWSRMTLYRKMARYKIVSS